MCDRCLILEDTLVELIYDCLISDDVDLQFSGIAATYDLSYRILKIWHEIIPLIQELSDSPNEDVARGAKRYLSDRGGGITIKITKDK